MLNKLSLSEAKSGLKLKKFSSAELVQSCLDQIKKNDSVIHSFLCLNPNALSQAQQSDINLPLGGIPIAVKDNFLTQGLTTTASSKVLENYSPHYESTVTRKLKEAGAIIIGKTNMDAWAHGSSTETSDFGPTKNPWNTNHLPGGSSGGSAAAVSADMCTFAVGTETAGSIRQPAAWCGVTGLKPTYGRVSRYGVIAMASSTDSPGPMTKSADDAGIVLDIIAGADPYDATSGSVSLDTSPLSLSGLKIGIPKEYMLASMSSATKDLIYQAAKELEKLGAKISEISLLDPKYSIAVYTIIQRSEVSSNLARYDGIRYGNTRDAFGDEAMRRIMLGTFALSAGYSDKYYHQAEKVRSLIISDYNRAFSEVDLIIGPTSPGPALKVGASLDQPMFGEMEDILVEASSIAGLPGISIPCGFVDGLPIGLQIVAQRGEEQKVISAARHYQSATRWHNERPHLN